MFNPKYSMHCRDGDQLARKALDLIEKGKIPYVINEGYVSFVFPETMTMLGLREGQHVNRQTMDKVTYCNIFQEVFSEPAKRIDEKAKDDYEARIKAFIDKIDEKNIS